MFTDFEINQIEQALKIGALACKDSCDVTEDDANRIEEAMFYIRKYRAGGTFPPFGLDQMEKYGCD